MKYYDVVILGAGIAGLSAAEACIRKGWKTAIIDTASPGSGASGAPLVITNSATGRRAKKVHRSEHCLEALEKSLAFAQKQSETPFYRTTPVLRPALTEEIAHDFRRAGEKYNWSSSDLEWMDPKPFAEKYPFLGHHYGGLCVQHAFTINPKKYLNYLSEACVELGLETFYHQPVNEIMHSGEDGIVVFDGQKALASANSSENREFPSDPEIVVLLNHDVMVRTKRLVYAVGAGIRAYSLWDSLPLSFLKGEVLDLHLSRALPSTDAISGLGYIACDPVDDRHAVIGSTFSRKSTEDGPTCAGEETLMEKFRRLLPLEVENVHHRAGWAGVRVTASDYQPVVGEHPMLKGHFVMTGLGSKGMLMSSYLAQLLVSCLMRSDSRGDRTTNLEGISFKGDGHSDENGGGDTHDTFDSHDFETWGVDRFY